MTLIPFKGPQLSPPAQCPRGLRPITILVYTSLHLAHHFSVHPPALVQARSLLTTKSWPS